MGETTVRPDWAINTELALKAVEEGTKRSETIDRPDWAKEIEKDSYSLARQKYTGEADSYRKAGEAGYIIVDRMVKLYFTESAGLYLSRFFTAIRDEGKILATRCPKCRGVVFPPKVMCKFCKVGIPDVPENWLELSDKGTVISHQVVTGREVDRATGKIVGEPYPLAYIRLDGGDQWTIFAHYLEEPKLENLRIGMRVQAVWKPRAERQARMTDIRYFRTISE